MLSYKCHKKKLIFLFHKKNIWHFKDNTVLILILTVVKSFAEVWKFCSQSILHKMDMLHQIFMVDMEHSLQTRFQLACWCPGSLCHQAIIKHGIDFVFLLFSSLRVSFMNCITLMLRNCVKCNYMFMFLQTNLACKCLKTTEMLRVSLNFQTMLDEENHAC